MILAVLWSSTESLTGQGQQGSHLSVVALAPQAMLLVVSEGNVLSIRLLWIP